MKNKKKVDDYAQGFITERKEKQAVGAQKREGRRGL